MLSNNTFLLLMARGLQQGKISKISEISKISRVASSYMIKIVNLWILLEFTVIIDGFSKDFKSGLQDFKVVADPSANVELFA